MNPRKKAKELIERMNSVDSTDDYLFPSMQMRHAIKCGLISVDEIIDAMDNAMLHNQFKQYWNEVKQEIQKL